MYTVRGGKTMGETKESHCHCFMQSHRTYPRGHENKQRLNVAALYEVGWARGFALDGLSSQRGSGVFKFRYLWGFVRMHACQLLLLVKWMMITVCRGPCGLMTVWCSTTSQAWAEFAWAEVLEFSGTPWLPLFTPISHRDSTVVLHILRCSASH